MMFYYLKHFCVKLDIKLKIYLKASWFINLEENLEKVCQKLVATTKKQI